jgi:ATP-dependent protease ClpP protease subunit
MPNIRPIAQARNAIQVSVVNNAIVISSAANVRLRLAGGAVDAAAPFWMMLDLTPAPVSTLVVPTSSSLCTILITAGTVYGFDLKLWESQADGTSMVQ